MKALRLTIGLLGVGAGVLFGSEAEYAVPEDPDFEPKVLRSEYATIRLSKIAGPFEHPWAVGFLPDGRILVTERPGRLNVVEEGKVRRVEGLPDIHARGQGGLLDVSVHPDYDETQWIYITYSKPDHRGRTATALARGRINAEYQWVDHEDIFVQNRYSSPGRHYGSRLAWMPDGTLLMSIGDRGAEPPRAQDKRDHAGSILRLHDDGSAPDDNPFVNDETVLDEIHSYGFRNVQGLLVDQDNGTIWASDHGPRGGDLLHRPEPGKNYGWPVVTRGLDYRTQERFPDAEARRMQNIEDPAYDFGPTHPPSGLALVTADEFPMWKGNLLSGGLLSERIRRLVLWNHEVVHDEELLLGVIGRIRDIREGPDGRIYVLNDERRGALYVLERSD